MSATVTYPHIEVNADGVPILSGTTTKVVEVVLDHLAWGWDAQEIHRQHSHLSLGQIHSCLAYYFDHREAMDRDIERRERLVEELRAKLETTTLRDRLRAAGKLP